MCCLMFSARPIRRARIAFLLSLTLCTAVGCGYGGYDDGLTLCQRLAGTSGSCIGPFIKPSVDLLTWPQSAHGTDVADASGDVVQFTTDGSLLFGATSHASLVAARDGSLQFEGRHIGSVRIIHDHNGSEIAALVTEEGYLIDVDGSTDHLAWRPSDRRVGGMATAATAATLD